MHPEAAEFIERICHVARWIDARVVEVGSLDVNGRARDCIPEQWGGKKWAEWVGVDLLPGPSVDVVADAEQWLYELPFDRVFDIAVCCEVLEHAPNWRGLLLSMMEALTPDGLLFLTCAGTGRPPHAADGSGPPRPGEYYQNVSLSEVVSVIGKISTLVKSEEGPPGDTRLVARKNGYRSNG